jgi:C-terminal processing protease CtpA/Prc
MRTLAAALILAWCGTGIAVAAPDLALPAPHSAAEALTQVMRTRHAAQNLLRPDAAPDAVRDATARLERLLALLDEQPYRDFGAASSHLYAERVNIGVPLAQAYVRLGRKDNALRVLESTTAVGLIPSLAKLEQDPGLAALRGEPRFQALLAKHRQGSLAARNGLASPYSETLTREQRIAGLSLFWSEVRHNFANADLMPPQQWDAVYLDYLAKVDQAATTADYYAVLMQLAPLLHDGHTNIYPPKELASRFFGRTPLETGLVEDTVVVLAVHDAALAQRIHPGDEIVAVGGVPVKAYAEKSVRPFVSSSTEQDRLVRTYGYQLLLGDAKQAVALTLKNARGETYQAEVARTGWQGADQRFPFRMLPGGIAYLRLDHFESDEGVKALERAWPEIRKAKGLILDVRTNGGGSTVNGTRILAHLADQPVQPTVSRVRFEDQSMRAQGGDYVGWRPLPASGAAAALPPEQVYQNPVALLIGPRSFSAAEDFAAMFAQAKRGPLVGEATAGSTGQPLTLQLPGGGTARICVKRDSFGDGSDFVGKGIGPTHVVKNTVAAVRDGGDPVLAAAEQLLLGAGPQVAAAPPP